MTTCSSTFAWKIPWTDVPGRLWSMRLLRVGYDSLVLCSSKHDGSDFDDRDCM